MRWVLRAILSKSHYRNCLVTTAVFWLPGEPKKILISRDISARLERAASLYTRAAASRPSRFHFAQRTDCLGSNPDIQSQVTSSRGYDYAGACGGHPFAGECGGRPYSGDCADRPCADDSGEGDRNTRSAMLGVTRSSAPMPSCKNRWNSPWSGSAWHSYPTGGQCPSCSSASSGSTCSSSWPRRCAAPCTEARRAAAGRSGASSCRVGAKAFGDRRRETPSEGLVAGNSIERCNTTVAAGLRSKTSTIIVHSRPHPPPFDPFETQTTLFPISSTVQCYANEFLLNCSRV